MTFKISKTLITQPHWLVDLIQNNKIQDLKSIFDNPASEEMRNLAALGLAECLRLRGFGFQQKAEEFYRLIANKLPGFKYQIILGLAECKKLSTSFFPENGDEAFELYFQLDNDNVPYETRQYSIFMRAEWYKFRPTLNIHYRDIKRAVELYQQLLNDSRTSPELKIEAQLNMADCLRRGGVKFPSDTKKAFELYQQLDNDQTPTLIREEAVFGMAMCYKMGDTNFKLDHAKASTIFNRLYYSTQSEVQKEAIRRWHTPVAYLPFGGRNKRQQEVPPSELPPATKEVPKENKEPDNGEDSEQSYISSPKKISEPKIPKFVSFSSEPPSTRFFQRHLSLDESQERTKNHTPKIESVSSAFQPVPKRAGH